MKYDCTDGNVIALIPAFNPSHEELLITVRSMLQQTHPVDICLVDDGSAQPIVSPFPHSRNIYILRQESNSGITEALRLGVDYCISRGYEYICRIDVGDVSYPERIEKQLEFMRANPQVGLLGAHSRVTDLQSKPLFIHGIGGGPKAVKAYLWKNSPFKHSTFFIRSDALRVEGSYNPRFNGAEDYELLLRFAKKGNVDCLEEVLIDYVEDPSGLSSRKRGLQLRRRLVAQFLHASPKTIVWYLGVLRTIVTIGTPRAWVRRVTLRNWRKLRPAGN